MTVPVAPALVTPEIPVVETDYDKIENNRNALIAVLESGKLKQSHGSWRGEDGSVCVLQAAYDLVS